MRDVWQVPGMAEKTALTCTYGEPVTAAEERGKRFAALLREYRMAARLKQEDVAERSGVSLRNLQRWEGGQLKQPDPEDVKAVCRVIGLSTVAAGIALGYLAPEDVEHLPEPPPPANPTEEEAIAIIRDPDMSDELKRMAVNYLTFLRQQSQPGAGKTRAAS